MTRTLLDVENLSAGYDGRIVLADCSFRVMPEEIILILGHNGAGKSTLLKTINGSLSPSKGLIKINGREEWNKNEFAFLPQRNNVFLEKTLRENLNIGLLGSFTANSMKTDAYLVAFLNQNFPDLTNELDNMVGTFSGGMMQMTALARVLLTPNAQILLLDEPTLGLSGEQAKIVMKMLKNVAKFQGKTIILVEHNLDIALDIADHVLIIKRGNIVFDDYPSHKLDLADIKQFYF